MAVTKRTPVINSIEVNGTIYYINDSYIEEAYLPLTAGSDKPLTGDLYANADVKIKGEAVIDCGYNTEEDWQKFTIYTDTSFDPTNYPEAFAWEDNKTYTKEYNGIYNGRWEAELNEKHLNNNQSDTTEYINGWNKFYNFVSFEEGYRPRPYYNEIIDKSWWKVGSQRLAINNQPNKQIKMIQIFFSVPFTINNLTGATAVDVGPTNYHFMISSESGIVVQTSSTLPLLPAETTDIEGNIYRSDLLLPENNNATYIEIETSGDSPYINIFKIVVQYWQEEDYFGWTELAKKEEVDTMFNSLDGRVTVTENTLDTVVDGVALNKNNIETLNQYVGEIQIDDVVNNLPAASSEFLYRFFRFQEKLYQCVDSEGSYYWEGKFNTIATGSSPNMTQLSDIWHHALEVTAYQSAAIEADSVGDHILKLGTSSKYGSITLRTPGQYGLKVVKTKIHVKPWPGKTCSLSVSWEKTNGDINTTEYIFSDEYIIEINDILSTAGEIIVTANTGYERRFYITQVEVTIGGGTYEWKEIGGGAEDKVSKTGDTMTGTLILDTDNGDNKIEITSRGINLAHGVDGVTISTVVSDGSAQQDLIVSSGKNLTMGAVGDTSISGSSITIDSDVENNKNVCINNTEIPANSSLATQSWVNTQGFIKNLNIENGTGDKSIVQKLRDTTFTLDNPNASRYNQTITCGATAEGAAVINSKGLAEGKQSFVGNNKCVALADRSTAFGNLSSAEAYNSFACGNQTVAKGNAAHAEGDNTIAEGLEAHAEGYKSYAKGNAAHAEGSDTKATNTATHAEGNATEASGYSSHAEGVKSLAGDARYSGVFGYFINNDPIYIDVGGTGTISISKVIDGEGYDIIGYIDEANRKIRLSVETSTTQPSATNPLPFKLIYTVGGVEPTPTPTPTETYYNAYTHAEGFATQAYLNGAHAEGYQSTALGQASHAEGNNTLALGAASHTSGTNTIAVNNYETVVGKFNETDTTDKALFTVGNGSSDSSRSNAFVVYNDNTAKLGTNLIATQNYVATAINNGGFSTLKYLKNGNSQGSLQIEAGSNCTASNQYATALGYHNTASGYGSFAIGGGTTASSYWAFSGGEGSQATANHAFAYGLVAKAGHDEQFAIGKYNENKSNTLFEVGKGTSSTPSNAFEVCTDGTAKVGAMGTDNLSVATKKYVDDNKGASNIKNGTGYGSVQTIQLESTGPVDTGTFDFTGKNPNATALDATLTGNIAYGGVGQASTAFGGKSSAQGGRSLAQGTTTIAKGHFSHAEGDNSVTIGADSHAEGYATTAYGNVSHSEGYNTVAKGAASHAEGINTVSEGTYSHAEGHSAKVVTVYTTQDAGSFTPGGDPGQPASLNNACGSVAHAEGSASIALGYASHSQGSSHAYGHYSFASGMGCQAGDIQAVSGGYKPVETEKASHALGIGVYAKYNAQTCVGKFNNNYPTTLFEVGNGQSHGNRSNAFEVYQDGHATVGAMGTTDLSVATKQYVDDKAGATQVVGNPSGTSQDTLSKIKIGDVIYDVFGGGGTTSAENVPSATIITNLLTNLNGRTLTTFKASSLITSGSYSYYNITETDNTKLTEDRAKEYMRYMTGFAYASQYNYDFPKNTLLLWPSSNVSCTVLKPQWSSTDGLRIYVMPSKFAMNVEGNYLPLSGGTLTGPLTVNGLVTAEEFYATSDARAKKNIKDAQYDYLNIVDDIRLREFNYKKDSNESDKRLGVVAQELEEILPESLKAHLINTPENTDEFKSVADAKLVYVLLGAVKELSKKVNDLEEQLKNK